MSSRIMRWGIVSLMLRTLISALGKINILLILCGSGSSTNQASSESCCSYAGGEGLFSPTWCLKKCLPLWLHWLTVCFSPFFASAPCRHLGIELEKHPPVCEEIQYRGLSAFYRPSLYTSGFCSAGLTPASIRRSLAYICLTRWEIQIPYVLSAIGSCRWCSADLKTVTLSRYRRPSVWT